ncbi:uncharacterized protein ACR2FA_005596 [Aphomia sociella]
MNQDSLVYMPLNNWRELQTVFKSNWPRGISGYYALETQMKWTERGLLHDFNVYCPFGDATNGIVVFNKKSIFNEIIIQCPKDDTTQLEEALRKTKLINSDTPIVIPFAPSHISDCVHKVTNDLNMDLIISTPHEIFILDKVNPSFENISLPDGLTFKTLSKEHIQLVDSSWVNRYDSSVWYFQLLVTAQSGFGLFQDDQLACWVLINEVGALTHLYTLDDYRKKGYAETLLKLLCNDRLKQNMDSFAYCKEGNERACSLYKKLGFTKFHKVNWCYLKPKSSVVN